MDSDASPIGPGSGRATRRGVPAAPPPRRAPHPRRVRRAISRARRADPRPLPGPRADRGAQAHARGPCRPVGRPGRCRRAGRAAVRLSGWATTRCSASWAAAAWGSSTRPSTIAQEPGGAEGHAPAVPCRPGLRAAVPDRGPLGGEAAPHQHRAGLRLRRAGRRLLLRDAMHRRRRPGAGAGGCPPPPGRGQPRDRGPRRHAAGKGTTGTGRGPAHGHLPRPADRPVHGFARRLPSSTVRRERDSAAQLRMRSPTPGCGSTRSAAAPSGGGAESSQQFVRRPARVGLFPRGRAPGRPGRRRAGLRPPPGGHPPRHQALQPPARRPRERLGHRFRPGQAGRGGRPLAVARPGRDAAVHGPRAVPGRHRPRWATSTRWARRSTSC